jgi:hypothetical protein
MAIGLNERITFGRRGTARALKCRGIDFEEAESHSWTCDPVSELEIELPFARQDVSFQIEASPFIVPHRVDSQQVFLFVAGLFTGFFTLEGFATNVFPISRNVLSGRETRLTLVIPTAISPKRLKLGDDERQLGIYISTILFSAAE